MKNILVLGGFGFIGTNLIKYADKYLKDTFRFIIFDHNATHPLGECFQIVDSIYSGDFSNEECLENIFKEQKIDLVVHAISTIVPVLSSNRVYDIESNLIPSVKFFDLMVKYNVRDIIFISSGGAVYGDGNIAHKEDDILHPRSSYGIVKVTIEQYLRQYALLGLLNPLILRLSNPYGPYHRSTHQGVINIAISKALKGETFEIWGDGHATKDYIFIEDFCDLLFSLHSKGITNETINIASGETLSVTQILEAIKDKVPTFKWESGDKSKYDVNKFSLDTTLLKKYIGEYQFTSFEVGLKKVFDKLK